jgi:hypothetical protein
MLIYDVYIDNGLTYEDFSYNRYFIGAENIIEAKKIAIDMFERNWNTTRNISVNLISKTDNDIPVIITQK